MKQFHGKHSNKHCFFKRAGADHLMPSPITKARSGILLVTLLIQIHLSESLSLSLSSLFFSLLFHKKECTSKVHKQISQKVRLTHASLT